MSTVEEEGALALIELRESLETKLNTAGVPQKLFGTDILSVLLWFLVEYLQGCLEVKSPEAIASDMADMNGIRSFIFERRVARKVYRGNKNFKNNYGHETVVATLSVCEEAKPETLLAFSKLIAANNIPEVNPDYILVNLPSL